MGATPAPSSKAWGPTTVSAADLGITNLGGEAQQLVVSPPSRCDRLGQVQEMMIIREASVRHRQRQLKTACFMVETKMRRAP